MLNFAAGGNSGTYQEISQMTGIPMGKSTGKVQPTLNYCRGMGLLTIDTNAKSSIKSPQLTPFGRTVLLEDSRMGESITQWIAHFHMCSPKSGADAWYHVFMRGRDTLGLQFRREQLNGYLKGVYEITARNLIGPMMRMYEEDASFSKARVLVQSSDKIERIPAPVELEYTNAYTAWTLSLMELHFPKSNQVTITELDRVCGWQSIPAWSMEETHKVLGLIEARGAIEVDRQMQPWILRKAGMADSWWPRLYDDLI
jgi:hypothetical protein